MTKFPSKLQDRLAITVASTKRLADTAHQRLNTIGSQVSALVPGAWQQLTLTAGWSDLPGYVPAQVRIQQTGLALLTGTITGGITTVGTIIATLPPGYYSPAWSQSFTVNVLTGAGAMPVAGTITGSTDTNALANGGVIYNSSAAAGPGSHTHGSGTYAVNNSNHHHTNAAGGQVPSVPISYDTCVLTVSPMGNLTLTNCPAAATQLSFCEHLPLA